ncbi:MAG TPA: arylamine N-acetyltransferase [Hypericibacter adhaerens]|uniref:arylamine N-acetyltransferase family protein n=1 Tax=Hypericibacter adhaerens TaxID=2602016 RepID=UPI002BCA37BD|nr:arylamine N-acetyltransferase [Hypericibacter adhaerens]HWA42378.1 arylamine N-acetyltransferase [Hypericibacter adhaerens]
MSDEANLDAYLKRINYAGSIAPTLETLEMVHRLHPQAIPFENLDPLMEQPVRLQLSDIEQKLLIERRGGYCFEHNLLLKAVLETMDFKVTPLAAGVLWGREPGYEPPELNHMALLVDVGGVPYLADVGFGGQVATAPLRLRADVEQQTPNERYRLLGGHPKWRLETEVEGQWKPLYEFTTAARTLDDYMAMNDLTMGLFRDDLIAARVEGPRRYALWNTRLRTHEGGATETRILANIAEIREVLTATFGLVLPPSDRLDPALEKALRPRAAG